MNEEQTKEYETPEIFELGRADTLTHGRCLCDWPDTLQRYIFVP